MKISKISSSISTDTHRRAYKHVNKDIMLNKYINGRIGTSDRTAYYNQATYLVLFDNERNPSKPFRTLPVWLDSCK